MWPFWKRQEATNRVLTEKELEQMKERLRFQLTNWVEKVVFVDAAFDEHPAIQAVVFSEDKRSLAIAGIDPIIEDFLDFMRTRVKPDGTKN